MTSPTQWPCTWANHQVVRDREACHAAVHGATKGWTGLGD